MKIASASWMILLSLILLALPAAVAGKSCESLTALTLPHTTITLAEPVAAGALTLPGVPGPNPPAAITEMELKDLPAFCRVAITMKPSADSDIKAEVWMPTSGWNGKFMAVGNGGWAGTISYEAMTAPLVRGYATASTDTGHKGTALEGSFALGHPEKLIDFGYRAVHEMTVLAKDIIATYYENRPKLSYWNGCSTGGKQGLKEAQKFPGDYDGIVAGAPANFWTHLNAQYMWVAQAVNKSEASRIPPSKFPLIHDAVLRACDARDGVKDEVLENPARCKFDPKVLECKGADMPSCLTAAQVESARAIYSASMNPRTKQQIFPGLAPGSELGWAIQTSSQPFSIPTDYYKYVVYKDPNWDYKTFNFDSDIALADKIDNGLITATDPHLKEFFAHGGKLLQYHGWSDNIISPQNSINYYESVIETLGGADRVQDSYRLFMVPGMSHCRDGEGVTSFDSISVIEQWVEKGKAPGRIMASRIQDGKTQRTRPLCPYPQVAKYMGTGSSDDAANFVCASEK